MKRVLVTGLSGTGKSTLIEGLAARGYKAVDADYDGWSELRGVEGASRGSKSAPEQEWLWREDRIQELLSTEDAEVLFLSGCASNQAQFYPRFDYIVLLTAPVPLILERLATRTNNHFGKGPDELAQILQDQRDVEPRLRRVADLEVDTSASLDQLIATVLQFVLSGEESVRTAQPPSQ
ncbi:MAG: AAA family ATPase [Dehalococcoidia bacterium]|nr:AAA family ATPase [Dehalococcoidia bacterium]